MTNETEPARLARLRREIDAGWTVYHVGDLPEEPYNGPEDSGWGDYPNRVDEREGD
jgi:hypothetical protein